MNYDRVAVVESARTEEPAMNEATTRRALIAFALVASALLSRPRASHGQASPAIDDSVPCPLVSTDASLWLRFVDPAQRYVDLRGRVLAIHSITNVHRIELAGVGPRDARSFTINGPTDLPIPFGVGATIDVHIGGVFYTEAQRVDDAAIRDHSGGLLLYAGPRPPQGWELQMRAGHSDVDLVHLGHRAHLVPQQWRRLDTADGSWLVSGEAIGNDRPQLDIAGRIPTVRIVRLADARCPAASPSPAPVH
jgi:hypothetical protein